MTAKIVFPQNDEVYTLFLHQDRKRPTETEIHTVLYAADPVSIRQIKTSCWRNKHTRTSGNGEEQPCTEISRELPEEQCGIDNEGWEDV